MIGSSNKINFDQKAQSSNGKTGVPGESFTFGGEEHNELITNYKDLPREILKVLDTKITSRAVHLLSEQGKAALSAGLDPEKISQRDLEQKGLLKTLN